MRRALLETKKQITMPKQKLIKVQLAPERYDRCKDCPLCGLVPEADRKGDFKYVCLATFRGMTQEDIDTSNKTNHHCENYWESFMQLPDSMYTMRIEFYEKYRVPYEIETR